MNQLYQVSEIELVYKTNIKATDRPRVFTSADAYNILSNNWDENKIEFVEQAKVLLLNRAHYVLGIYTLSTGGLAGTVVDPRLVFAAALKANAHSIVLAHNHPSGNTKPSNADMSLTTKFKEAGKFLDITVVDHLIISPEGYYSFADNYDL